MENKASNCESSRRQFLFRNLTAGTMLCLGCQTLLASTIKSENKGLSPGGLKEKNDQGMASEDVVRYALNYSIPILKKLQDKIGKNEFVEMLKNASSENISEIIAGVAKDMPVKDMKALAGFLKSYLSTPPYDKALAYQIVEESETVFELKYTKCLMAEIFREMKAEDIGYAMECYPSDAAAKAFNPKMKATGTKNLMLGDSYCLERFELTT